MNGVTEYTIRRGEATACPDCGASLAAQMEVAVLDQAFALGGEIRLESWECQFCGCRHRDGRALPSL